MHELSIALSLLDLVAEEAESRGGRVVAVHLKLGPLSGVVKDALLSAYELAREGTPFAETALVVQDVPLIAWCPGCGVERGLNFPELCCPTCGEPTPDIKSGRELEVVALEIES
jgi:hydrogenase nickel incorporation protein HypA/HybF